jgi:hypothetical protein
LLAKSRAGICNGSRRRFLVAGGRNHVVRSRHYHTAEWSRGGEGEYCGVGQDSWGRRSECTLPKAANRNRAILLEPIAASDPRSHRTLAPTLRQVGLVPIAESGEPHFRSTCSTSEVVNRSPVTFSTHLAIFARALYSRITVTANPCRLETGRRAARHNREIRLVHKKGGGGRLGALGRR